MSARPIPPPLNERIFTALWSVGLLTLVVAAIGGLS